MLVVGQQSQDGAVRVPDIRLAELVGQDRRPEQVPALVRRRGRELRRAGQRRHGGRDGTAPDGSVGDQLELGGEGRVIPGRRPGPVQDSLVGAGAHCSRQRQVPSRPAARRREVINGRSHQPVAKTQFTVRQLDKARDNGRLQDL